VFDLELKIFRLHQLGIPQDRIAKRLGVPQQTISRHLPKMLEFTKWVNIDLSKGFTVQQVAQKHGWPESLVWPQALVNADSFDRFKALQWGIRTWDVWNFMKCERISSNKTVNLNVRRIDMDSVYLLEARYVTDFKVFLKFNTGESGEVDLKKTIFKYKIAESLRDPEAFSKFYLDSWPTLAWECGFDIAPESLYFMATGKSKIESTSVA
jgi:hypothetical protein